MPIIRDNTNNDLDEPNVPLVNTAFCSGSTNKFRQSGHDVPTLLVVLSQFDKHSPQKV
jgi:hypothetical protein